MEASEILVSIIMPVYNVEAYVKESLESIANQSFENYEIIIVNDGSTDGSELVINEFIEENKKINIQYIKQENAGQSAARNEGIARAKGEYIYFFDSDDLIDAKAIELLYEKSKEKNLDLLLFSGESFFETDDAQATQYAFNYVKNEDYPKVINGQELFIELIKNDDYSTSPCLYLVSKKLLLEENLKFYEGIIHEDALFTYQVILSAKRTLVINDVLFFRRVRLHSTMTTINYTKRFLGLYTVLIEMIKFREKLKVRNAELNLAIHNRLSDAFGNAINQYIYMDRQAQLNYQNEIKNIKAIGKEYDYFGRRDYWLFGKQQKLYMILRKSFDYLKRRKGK